MAYITKKSDKKLDIKADIKPEMLGDVGYKEYEYIKPKKQDSFPKRGESKKWITKTTKQHGKKKLIKNLKKFFSDIEF